MSSSNTFAKNILDHLTGNASWATAALYISLHTGDPGATGANEVSNATYSRVTSGGFGVVSAGTSTCTNSSAETFAQGGNDETVSHAGVFTHLSNGSAYVMGGSLTTSFTYGASTQPVFDAGSITLNIPNS